MTPSQLERAARHYCNLMGVDPEEMVQHGVGGSPIRLVALSSPQWKLVAQELKSLWAMNEALKEGMLEDGDLIAESPST